MSIKLIASPPFVEFWHARLGDSNQDHLGPLILEWPFSLDEHLLSLMQNPTFHAMDANATS